LRSAEIYFSLLAVPEKKTIVPLTIAAFHATAGESTKKTPLGAGYCQERD
jgi:hypothetical protein|tara:strand:- start:189 stop:338 length:150 start_codon:yes stop_codon:yes gene_type:complete